MTDRIEINASTIPETIAKVGQTVGQTIRSLIIIKNNTDYPIHVSIEKELPTDDASPNEILSKSICQWGRKAGTYKVKIILIEFSMTKKLI